MKTLTGVACALMVVGCSHAQTTKLTTAENAPAAMGSVKTTQGENGNTEVTVTVEHLAPPARIASGASTYVVWAKPASQDAPQNLGAMTVDDALNGKLQTKTALTRFDLMIAAEPTPTIAQPNGAPVMQAHVDTQR
jgi:hypothetical protein